MLAFSLVLLPLPVFGAGKYDAGKYDSGGSSSRKKKKKKKVKKAKPAEEEQAVEAERAQGDDEEESQGSRRKKKRRPKVIEANAEGEGKEVTGEGEGEAAPAKTDKPKAAPAATATATPAAEEEEDDDVSFDESPSKVFEVLNKAVPPRRYAYVIGAVVGGVGLVFAYQAQGEAKRAETIVSALEAQRAVGNARASAALANVMYGLAGAAVLLALVLEFIPEPIAEKAALTFRF